MVPPNRHTTIVVGQERGASLARVASDMRERPFLVGSSTAGEHTDVSTIPTQHSDATTWTTTSMCAALPMRCETDTNSGRLVAIDSTPHASTSAGAPRGCAPPRL